MKRRDFLQNSIALAASGCLPSFIPSTSKAQTATIGQVIFIFLRGGADALSITPPSGSASTLLKTYRPQESVLNPIPLYSGSPINLHPLLAPMISDTVLKSRLNFILHVGSPYNTLSHFEQMARVETGNMSGSSNNGIFGRAATLLNRSTFAIGNSVPTSLRGTDPVVLNDPAKLSNGFSSGNLKPGPGFTRSLRLGMYKKFGTENSDIHIDKAARVAQNKFDLIETGSATNITNLVPSANGYVNDSYSLGRRLALSAHMLSSAANPLFVTVDAEMAWDTHAGQATNNISQFNSFAGKVDVLAKNLLALKKDLVARGKWATTAVVIISEFGRTVKENGSAGTDHGRGGLMILMGGRIRPFQDSNYKGIKSWSIPTSADASTALSVSHDYRTVLAEVLQKNCGLTQNQLTNIFLNQINFTNYLNVI